jgi:hypothetical protein
LAILQIVPGAISFGTRGVAGSNPATPTKNSFNSQFLCSPFVPIVELEQIAA